MTDNDLRKLPFFEPLTKLPYVDAIYVFGSRATGNYTPQSDLDLAILCPDASEERWNDIVKLIRDSKTLMKVDVVRLDRVTDAHFLDQISQTKSLLYLKPYYTHISSLGSKLEPLEKLLDEAVQFMENKNGSHAYEATVLNYFRRVVQFFIRLCRRALLAVGLREESPLLILRAAFTQGWLNDRERWEQLFQDWQYAIEPSIVPDVRRDILERMPDYLALVRNGIIELKKAHHEMKPLHSSAMAS